MGLVLARTLVMARLLDISGFAQFSGGLLVSSTFTMLGCLGLQSLLQRDMPVQIVRGRELAAAVLAMQCLLVALLCALAGLGVPLAGFEIGGIEASMVGVGVVHGLSQQVFVIATVESRSRGQPVAFAWQTFFRAAMALAASSLIAWIWHSAQAALLAEAVLSMMLTSALLRKMWRRLRLQPGLIFQLAWTRMGQLPWGSAMALLAVTVVAFLFLNLDRWVAAQLLRPSAFAQYAFAWTILMVAQSLQSVINAAVFPMLARRFAASGRPAAFRLAAKASMGLLLACAVLAWPGYLALEAVVARWFPAYAEATTLLSVFVIVAVLRLSDFWSSYAVIVGSEKRLLGLNGVVGLAVVWFWSQSQAADLGSKLDMAGVARLAWMLTVAGYATSGAAAWSARK